MQVDIPVAFSPIESLSDISTTNLLNNASRVLDIRTFSKHPPEQCDSNICYR